MERSAGKNDHDGVRVDYLHADLGIGHWFGGDADVMLGRIKIPLGLYNETRDVAGTRPSIILPQSVYYENSRTFLINSDGAAVNWRAQVGPNSYWATFLYWGSVHIATDSATYTIATKKWTGIGLQCAG